MGEGYYSRGGGYMVTIVDALEFIARILGWAFVAFWAKVLYRSQHWFLLAILIVGSIIIFLSQIRKVI